jgi:acyl dehydratase
MDQPVFTRVLDWRFMRPIYIGDTVHVQTFVLDKRPSGRRRGIVTWKRQLVNQHNEVVQEGTTETMVLWHAAAAPR